MPIDCYVYFPKITQHTCHSCPSCARIFPINDISAQYHTHRHTVQRMAQLLLRKHCIQTYGFSELEGSSYKTDGGDE
jgi:hypothetical protein